MGGGVSYKRGVLGENNGKTGRVDRGISHWLKSYIESPAPGKATAYQTPEGAEEKTGRGGQERPRGVVEGLRRGKQAVATSTRLGHLKGGK